MSVRSGIMAGLLICSGEKVLADSAIIFEDGVITDIIPNSKAKGMSGLRDERSNIVCPSFVNTHTHMYGVISHGTPIGNNSPTLKPRLETYWWPKVEDMVDKDIIKAATQYACLDMLRYGITCFDDTLEAPNALPNALAEEADIVEKVGMRAVLGFEATERVGYENGLAGLEENRSFILRQRQKNSLVKGIMCAHTTFSCSKEFLRKAHSLAVELDTSLQIHLSESVDEPRFCFEKYGKLPVEFYEEIGVLSERLFASQCVVVDNVEIEMLARRGARVSHQPISNANGGCGIAPVPEMLEKGIKVGLGSDGVINDMFEIMRMAYMIQKAKRMNSVSRISPAEILTMATKGGAEALGFDKIGTLQKGNFADFLVISGATPTALNASNVFDQLLRFRNSGDLIATAVNGQYLFDSGSYATLDAENVKKNIREITDAYWERLM